MTREGIVVKTPQGLMAQVKRQEACLTCRACEFGRTEEITYPLPEGNYNVGDTVDITLPDKRLFSASLLAYGVPLVFLIAGLCLGYLISSNELVQTLLALLFGGAGALILLASEKKRRKTRRYRCTVSKADSAK
ncbi:MAG: SoxR reducing system RseC family protein [Clostridiales bacterium]|nr:SoxR reducing system RseC family protein [Clostridiales bacterium]